MTNEVIDTTLQLWQNGRRLKRSSSGWLSGNAVCCHHNGQTQDRRGRGGVIASEDKINYSCFNCGFKTGYVTGYSLTPRFKQLLRWIGAEHELVDKLTFVAMKIREEQGDLISLFVKQSKIAKINFNSIEIPSDWETLQSDNSKHQSYVEYLNQRGLSWDSYEYYVTPDSDGRDANRIIIPYRYQELLVGHTSRYLDDRKPKYISEQQRGYVFNIDKQSNEWSVCILVEGQFDAISIGGCAYMGQNILDEQAELLRSLQRRIIVVPDRDTAGLSVCDRALELGYSVSIPEWREHVKDVNDAVKTYGRLPTLLSILQSATTSKIKVEMLKKRYR
jgi:hypothetical protein